jgi:tRNA-specific 2-thiouridylase
VLCNQQLKFGAFLDAVGPEVSAVASGHYARRVLVSGTPEERALLARSPDPVKDQTYFLARLSREQVERCRFPIGHLHKSQVRRLAEELALPNRHRPDSQGICFLGKIPFREFIRHHLGEQPGEIRHAETGERLGEHRGHWFHTLGQRKGLGLSGGPWYVVGKDAEENQLLVSHRERLDSWAPESFEVEALHWLAEPLTLPAGSLEPGSPLRVRLRHGGTLLPFRLETPTREASIRGRARVVLSQGDPGIAPGQFAVFYAEDTCIGSGIISSTHSAKVP